MTILRTPSGHYVVGWFTDFVPWLQWRAWNYDTFRETITAQSYTTDLAYPPETAEGVELVISRKRARREEIDKERGPHSRFAWRRIPDSPPLFEPWTGEFCAELESAERARRALDGKSFTVAPAYPYSGPAALAYLKKRVASPALQRSSAENQGKPPAEMVDPDLDTSGLEP